MSIAFETHVYFIVYYKFIYFIFVLQASPHGWIECPISAHGHETQQMNKLKLSTRTKLYSQLLDMRVFR